ncbi:MAG: holin family protein [Chromatiales bacterium]|nr:holin family protein [Chromatiales bacterium]
MGILDFVSGIFRPATDLIDDLHTSDEEKMTLENKRLELKKELHEIQSQVTMKMIDYQSQLDRLQSDIIKAEAASSSWLARNWRPITMLVFVSLIVGRFLGWIQPSDEAAFKDVEKQLFNLIQIGLGGYVVGRSVEKVATTVSQSKRAGSDDAVG